MIILITFGIICFAAYAVFMVDFMADKFNGTVLGLFASLFAILIPPAIIVQCLVYFGAIAIK